MERSAALIVTRDRALGDRLRSVLERHGLAAEVAPSLTIAAERPAGSVWLDVTTAEAREALATSTANGSVVVALAAAGEPVPEQLVEAGAFDVLVEPWREAAIEPIVARVVRQQELLAELRALRGELEGEHAIALVGRSSSTVRLRERLIAAATNDEPLWLWGERGVGKEAAARFVHRASSRGLAGFVPLPASADPAWPAVFERAAGGTLYLDGLDALAPARQDALAAALERALDVADGAPRVIAATVDEPQRLAAAGRLDERLVERLGATTIHVPPLRERREDVPLIVHRVLDEIRRVNHLPPMPVAPDALAALEAHAWPENVRELRLALEHAAIVCREGTITFGDLPEGLATPAPRTSADRSFRAAKREVVREFEREYLADLMRRNSGNVTTAAQRAGMLRSALQRLLRKHGLRSVDFRAARRPAREQRAGVSPTR